MATFTETNPSWEAIYQDLTVRQHYDAEVVTALHGLLTGSASECRAAMSFLKQQGHHGIGDPSNDEDQTQLAMNVIDAKRFATELGHSTSRADTAKYAPSDNALNRELDRRSVRPAQRVSLKQSTSPTREGVPSTARDAGVR